MKLSARQKYDYRDLDRGEAQLIRLGHALWRDRRNWAIRSLKERGLTRHSKAFGGQRGNIGRNWPGIEPCAFQNIGRLQTDLGPRFSLETVPLEFR
jgi:hypothetical protein